ncbi:hypothetical protein [Methanoplanus endosymbiosus]|uniref:Uncharacterized protein n=1 Tax=Methanoplanus endosymbiosus TaxID=33865 RepID=A0A9E7PN84_9EURY|nr:hypothetical protein [Methanoplanus endosymbiosus]UUX93353.1 hypothetical protein L6E24_04290 [Methanoplanus endosymbiosus]
MDSKIKKSISLLFAVSLVALCLFSCGCTSQSEGTATENQAEIIALPPSGANPEMAGAGTQRGMGMSEEGRVEPVDLALAAETLGVTEDQLAAALGDRVEGEEIDLESAASELGVTVEELQEALGPQQDGMPPGGRGDMS